MTEISLRSATPSDAAALAAMLAAAQKEAGVETPHGAGAAVGALRDSLTGDAPSLEGVLAEDPDAGPVGFALAYRSFSTVTLRPGFHMLDIFVARSHRRRGVARLILQNLAGLAVKRGYAHILWSVQVQNPDAIVFYREMGAIDLVDAKLFAVAGDPLISLARGAAG